MGDTSALGPVIRTITFDCTGDPYDLGLFWSRLPGRPLADDDKPGDPEAVVPSRRLGRSRPPR